MNREQMLGSLQRIFVLQYFKTDEVGPYGEVIFEHCGWMDAYRFEAAVKEVVKTLKSNQRLKPAHFISAYHRLAEEQGWTRGVQKSCTGCGGFNFVPCWLKDKKGMEFRAVKGCPECNARFSCVHPDFEQISGPTFQPADKLQILRGLAAPYAQALLDMCGGALNKEQLDALCEAAAGTTPRKMLPRRINHTQRKNELVRNLIETPVTVQEEPEVEASVGSQPADVVEEPASGSPAPQAPEEKEKANVELSEEDLADIPF